MEFHGEVEFGPNSNRWPGNPGFPARWRSWLWFEGLRRKLGRWSSSGCGGFEIHGGELTKSAGERGGRSSVAHGVGRVRESEPRERVREWARVGEEDGARLQCGIREWAGTISSVGTWRRPMNLGLGVIEARPSRTVCSPKRTVREAGCYRLPLGCPRFLLIFHQLTHAGALTRN